MKFTVGDKEKHEIEFSYETMWGRVKILVDGKEHTSSRVMIMGHTPFLFQVGDQEKHQVRIELNNPIGFAMRGSDVKVFIDEKLTQQEHVGGSIVILLGFVVSIIIVLWLMLTLI